MTTDSTTKQRFSLDPMTVVAIGGLVVLVAQWTIMDRITTPALQTWSTIFVATCIQAIPFLLGGTLLSALIAVYIPAAVFNKLTPKNPVLAVPAAAAAGMALPGCECASVPVSQSLMKRGVSSAAALTFLLAAPAINPVVLVATAVAFQGQPEFVWARFIASAMVAIVMGWFWIALRKPHLLKIPKAHHHHDGDSKFAEFREATMHDFLHAGGFLVVGAAIAACMNVFIPGEWLSYVGERPWIAIGVMALLAFVVAMCSEADAFVAASFAHMGPAAQLTFMVVGPCVDVKLVAMQAGTFGRKFTAIFAPVTLIVAIVCAVLVGGWLL